MSTSRLDRVAQYDAAQRLLELACDEVARLCFREPEAGRVRLASLRMQEAALAALVREYEPAQEVPADGS